MESVNECVAIQCTSKQERRHNEVHLSYEPFVDSWTERENDCEDARFSRFLDAVGTSIDTLVSQIPSCNSLGFPRVVQSPVRHSPTNVAFA